MPAARRSVQRPPAGLGAAQQVDVGAATQQHRSRPCMSVQAGVPERRETRGWVRDVCVQAAAAVASQQAIEPSRLRRLGASAAGNCCCFAIAGWLAVIETGSGEPLVQHSLAQTVACSKFVRVELIDTRPAWSLLFVSTAVPFEVVGD